MREFMSTSKVKKIIKPKNNSKRNYDAIKLSECINKNCKVSQIDINNRKIKQVLKMESIKENEKSQVQIKMKLKKKKFYGDHS